MYGITLIPTICYELEPGEHCIADYFYGDGMEREGEELPAADLSDGFIRIRHGERVLELEGKRWL